MTKIVLLGKPQSTQNSYGQRGKIRYMKKEAKEVKRYYIEQIQKQYKGPVIEGPVIVSIDLYRINNLRRDRDNRHKISMDAMEGIVLKDDTQIQQAIVTKHKGDERIEVTITEL